MNLRWLLLVFFLLLTGPNPYAQDTSANKDVLRLADKFLNAARKHFESKEWFDCIEKAERSRTAYSTLLELYAVQGSTTNLRHPNESIKRCNQLIKLANDARKAEPAAGASSSPKPNEEPKAPRGTTPKPSQPPILPGFGTKTESRLRVPAVEKQVIAEKQIRTTFESQYAEKTRGAKVKLARHLVDVAHGTTDDPVTRFVLFREARDLAAPVGDARTAFSAVDEIGKAYSVEPLAMKIALVSKFPTPSTHEQANDVIHACLEVGGEAIRSKNFDLAGIVLRKAERTAKKPKNIVLMAKVKERGEALSEMKKAYETVKRAMKALPKSPGNRLENLAVGRFDCFYRNDWKTGLDRLSKCADADLKKLAVSELAGAVNPDDQLKLADAWLAVANKQKGKQAKVTIKLHAREWYERALPHLSGFQASRVEKLVRQWKNEEKWRWSVNLLEMVDVKRHSVEGQWRLVDGRLLSPSHHAARLQLPYIPPEEYDLKLIVACKPESQHRCLNMGLVGGGRQFQVIIDGWDGPVSGIDLIDGKGANGNESTIKGSVIECDGVPRTIIYSVRKRRVRVLVEGRPIIDWPADYRRVKLAEWWRVPNPRVLFVASYKSLYEFREISVTPISAEGRKLR